MSTLSVVIITYNEEENIGACLEAVKQVADEVIVVDSFSADRTKEICEQNNVRFVQKAWEGFSKTKNYANSLARCDYILSVDADEVLSDDLAKSIISFKDSENKVAEAYKISRITNFCGTWIKHGGWYPDYKIRIWKNGMANWTGSIHEKLEFTGPVKIEVLNGDLFHYSFRTIGQHIDQINRYTAISAFAAFEKGESTSVLQIWFKSKWKFFHDYILKRGFLDGYHGYIVCKNSAHAKFLKYAKLKELNRKG